MTMPSGYRIVSPGSERIDEFLAVDAWAFIFEPRAMDREATMSVLPVDRARAVEVADGSRGRAGEFAGVYSSTTYGMRIPGGDVLATSGLTWVGVHPGHRRRGLLTSMIDDHFRVSLEAGESVSTLYAMETAIYGRFGYGSCAPRLRVKAGDLAEFEGSADLTLRIERIDRAGHEPVVRAIHERMQRPGTMADPSSTMLNELLSDWPSDLEDNERSILAIVEDEHGPAGYAKFRRKMVMDETPSPEAKIHVHNISCATPAAARRIVSALADLDLISETRILALAPDDPVITLTKDIRAINATLLDGLWLRILDLPTALAARSYGADADVVVEVTDKQLPDNAGIWRLVIRDGAVEVARTDAVADVKLSIQDLSTAYLGREHVRIGLQAGLITESTPGKAMELNAAMRTDMEPQANMWF